ncbi:hypothetical protein [Glycomyces paridis]|uniref:Uncharacterized protein n=1 Tax=Glycomyces paridis TaxID=2126555 RepID=A0A4S8PJZ1_9ACTN|nr:hypothetical protein [Glycomyces paridis]THV28749.1 hypothetical protein E9998_11660 [Glycomyces paridis]
MNTHDDPGTLFRQTLTDDEPPPARFDLDRIVRDGYRVRRRQRALLGGAATTGVAAVAAVLALSLAGSPGERRETPAAGFDFHTAMAGYPGPVEYGERDTAADTLTDAAKETLGALAVDGGFLDPEALAYERPTESEIESARDRHVLNYGEALSELGYTGLPLLFEPWSSPGNGGQVYLRGYAAGDGDEEAERSAFTVEALLPGGWTADPGPAGAGVFPQHLVGDEASWGDEAPVFTSDSVNGGRTLVTADHGCAIEAAVVYPNGSALRSAWDLDCEGQGRELSMEDLVSAMLAMPEIDYDTSELAPVGELAEVPDGWIWDQAWEESAAADAQASAEVAMEALADEHPGAQLQHASPMQADTGAGTVIRAYGASGVHGFADDEGYPVTFSLTYYLPGGWSEGCGAGAASPEVYLVDCEENGEKQEDWNESEVDGRLVLTRTLGVGDSHSYFVYVFHPDGWAVEYDTSFAGELDGYSLDEVIAMIASLPAPVYDAEEYAQVD